MSGNWLVSKSRRRRQLGALESHYLWNLNRTGFAIALAIHSFDPRLQFCVDSFPNNPTAAILYKVKFSCAES